MYMVYLGNYKKLLKKLLNIGRDIFCLTAKKKDHGTTLGQFILVWSEIEKSKRTKAGVAVLIRKTLIKDTRYSVCQ